MRPGSPPPPRRRNREEGAKAPAALAPRGVEVRAATPPEAAQVLVPEALRFVADLAREFSGRRRELLDRRVERQAELDRGEDPTFLPETAPIREASWTIPPVPADLRDRRVEITGPTDRKMIINALNSGAKVFMADFEDANSPTWENLVLGQANLRDAVGRTIRWESPEGKAYRLNEKTATLMVRPRGWHLVEKHVVVEGAPVPASLFDFGLAFFHNARGLLDRGTGPYFYLPKLEGHLEARLWNDVFVFSQDRLGIPRGTIKATVLVETILAAFEMDEILWELREHSAGLNCGRWDYIFSCLKKFRRRPGFVLADRANVTMTTPFMRAYSLLAIRTCHRREAHSIGGMAAQIPIRDDHRANEEAIEKVRADKRREAGDGHDGTWVAHPGLVRVAEEEFGAVMAGTDQIDRKREDVQVAPADLLAFGPDRPITEAGLRRNVDIALQYLGSWLAGTGCVPIYHLMEDTATAEISRSQVWHWIQSPRGVLDDGRKVTRDLARQVLREEEAKLESTVGPEAYASGKYRLAVALLERLIEGDDLAEFLTWPGYELLD